MNLGPHTLTVLRAGTRASDYGTQDDLDWDTATATDVHGCNVQPASSLEFTIDRDSFTTRMAAYLPASADVRAEDRVVWRGDTYDVDGDVLRWDFPPLAYQVVNLRRSQDA